MRPSLVRWARPGVVLALVVLALYALHGELRAFRYHDVMRAAWAVPASRLLLALGWTAVAYAVLPGYDAVALRYVEHPLSLWRVGVGSFVAYGLSQTLGFPLVTGGWVRYRFWSAWGLSTTEIAEAASFAGATFMLGVVAISGAVFVLEPASSVALLRVPLGVVRAAGALCLTLIAAYLAWSAGALRTGGREMVRVRGWAFRVPPLNVALAQLAIAMVDWAAAGAVLYVLLPPGHGLGFLPFLGAFLLAQFAGLVSHVPGGIGVFETLVVLLLAPFVPANAVLGAVLVYRAVYYLVPFAIALLLLAAYEVRQRRERVAAAASVAGTLVGRWGPAVLPHALSITTFAGGAILLFSGATPSVRDRVSALDAVFPLGVIELSHLTGSLAGVGLIMLAWALRRRLDAAWGLAVALLVVGIVASLLKGLDWEEALALAVVLAALVPSRGAFYRKAALTSEPFSPGWVVAIVLVVVATVWLGFFSFKHVEYSNELWWRFRTHADAPRFLRATVGSLGVVIAFGLSRLLRHARAEPALPAAAEIERAEGIVTTSSDTVASLALLGDKALLFSDSGCGMLMYGVEGRSWVSLGDPIGPSADRVELAWRFRETADRHGGWPVFYEVGTRNLPLYIDLGLTLLKIGEEALVPLDRFSLDGGARKGLRRARNDVTKQGAVFEVVPPDAVPALLPELEAVSDAWLASKRTREKGFSLGRFDAAYLCHFPVALVRVDGRVVAFANLWTGAHEAEVSVDLMRYTDDAPGGVMEYLFIELMLWGKAHGYGRFNLGMAPLSGLENRQLAPLWMRAGALLFRHGEHFYNFQGLRGYKEKFDPVWEPRYIATPGGLALPRILANVAALISGGLSGVVAK